MKHTKRNLIGVVLIFFTAIAGGLWIAVSGWPPIIIRDRHYRELIGGFQLAMSKDRVRAGDNSAGWEFQVHIPNRQTTVNVWAPAYMGTVRVRYEDENDGRDLYKYVDYSHVQEIRTAESVLFVYWTETLFDTDHWILAYDLGSRREIKRRRIDPLDLRDID